MLRQFTFFLRLQFVAQFRLRLQLARVAEPFRLVQRLQQLQLLLVRRLLRRPVRPLRQRFRLLPQLQLFVRQGTLFRLQRLQQLLRLFV